MFQVGTLRRLDWSIDPHSAQLRDRLAMQVVFPDQAVPASEGLPLAREFLQRDTNWGDRLQV